MRYFRTISGKNVFMKLLKKLKKENSTVAENKQTKTMFL